VSLPFPFSAIRAYVIALFGPKLAWIFCDLSLPFRGFFYTKDSSIFGAKNLFVLFAFIVFMRS
jgi:hypothetical protein